MNHCVYTHTDTGCYGFFASVVFFGSITFHPTFESSADLHHVEAGGRWIQPCRFSAPSSSPSRLGGTRDSNGSMRRWAPPPVELCHLLLATFQPSLRRGVVRSTVLTVTCSAITGFTLLRSAVVCVESCRLAHRALLEVVALRRVWALSYATQHPRTLTFLATTRIFLLLSVHLSYRRRVVHDFRHSLQGVLLLLVITLSSCG